MNPLIRLPAAGMCALVMVLGVQLPHQAQAAENAQAIVDKAALTVEDIFSAGDSKSSLEGDLATARAVMVCPSMFQMSIAFGGGHGNCVLLARDARGSWSDPAFYKLSSASFGIQFGVQSSQIIFFVMTDRGLQALLDSQFQFDSKAGVSFANMSSSVASANAGARNTDIIIAQKSQGAFAGVSLGGSKLTVNSDLNRSYYKQSVGPEDIVVTMRVNNPEADPLRRVLMRYSQKNAASKATPNNTANNVAATIDNTNSSDSMGVTASSGSIRQESLTPVGSKRH